MGMSFMLIACRMVDPTPGSPKMDSVNMLPPIIEVKDRVIVVTTIIRAFRRACTTMALALEAPLARAVLMYSCRRVSCMALLVIRK